MFGKVIQMTKGIENIFKGNIAVGLEVIVLSEDSYEMNVVVLKKNKSAITVEKKAEGITRAEELPKIIDGNSPIILIINGKGIIHRKVSITEADTISTILNKVLPNANIDEFVLQRNPTDTSLEIISIIRTKGLNEVVEKLASVKIVNIADCLLGPFAINNVIPLMDGKILANDKIRFDKYQLQINAGQIIDISIVDATDTDERIVIGGEYIPSKLLVPFAGAVSYFVGETIGVLNSVKISVVKEEQKGKWRFELFGWCLLAATFLVLLINYFIFNSYWNKSREINTLFTLNQSALEKYEVLKTEFDQKNEFLQQNGLLENSRTSFYVDELAASLPESIQWNDVNICPIKKKLNSDEPEAISFENKTVTISGKCTRSADLNDWIKQIKKFAWINSTSLLDYRQDNANENGLFLINIEF